MLDASSGIAVPPPRRTLRLDGRSSDSGTSRRSWPAATAHAEAAAVAMAVFSERVIVFMDSLLSRRVIEGR
jgi:hypothetical protein